MSLAFDLVSPVGSPTMSIDYTNWRGVRGRRQIRPIKLWFGSTEFHPEPQFFIHAEDIKVMSDTKEPVLRDFAVRDIIDADWIYVPLSPPIIDPGEI